MSAIIVVPSLLSLPCDILDELFYFCDIKTIGRIATTSSCLSNFVKQPNRIHWKYRLCWLLRVPQEEAQNIRMIDDADEKEERENFRSLLQIALKEFPSFQQRMLDYDDGSLWLLEDFLEHRFYSWMKGWSVSVDLIGWNLYRIRILRRISDDVCAICHNYHGIISHYRGISNLSTTFIRRQKRSNKHFCVKVSSVWYFESRLVKPLSKNNNETRSNDDDNEEDFCVAIGVCTPNFSPWGCKPGWTREGIGYHSNGNVYHGGDALPYGPKFGVGDVIGCGFHISSRSIFFTKNGRFLGTAFSLIEEENYTAKNESLFPVIGLNTNIIDIIVNFGTNDAFEFDVTIAEELYDQYPPPSIGEKRDDQEEKSYAMKLLDNHKPIGESSFYLNSFHPWGYLIRTTRIPSPNSTEDN